MTEDTKFVEKHTDDKEVVPSTFREYFDEFKSLLMSIEADIVKSDKENKNAKLRVRKTLRLLKAKAAEFIKFSFKKPD